jgi:hypothetical protein
MSASHNMRRRHRELWEYSLSKVRHIPLVPFFVLMVLIHLQVLRYLQRRAYAKHISLYASAFDGYDRAVEQPYGAPGKRCCEAEKCKL